MSSKCRFLLLLLAAGLALHTRFSGLTRGQSTYLSPEQQAAGHPWHFYHFHPDEETLIRAALELKTPLDPPLTAYGMLPLYLLRAALESASLFTPVDLRTIDDPASAFRVYLVVRLLAVLLSLATLVLLYVLGCALLGAWTAALGLFFLAASPAAVQAAHFATVDGLHAFLVLVFFVCAERALRSGSWPWYLLAGLAIGGCGAVRFNGLLLGPVLLLGHLLQASGIFGQLTSLESRPGYSTAATSSSASLKSIASTLLRSLGPGLRQPGLYLAAGTALLAFILLQPFLLLDPGLLLRAEGTDDLAFSYLVAQGEILRPWTLIDVHTLPYLHYVTHLLPLASGWPLALAFLAGIGHGLIGRRRASALILAWCFLYFAQVGGLHTKHVRYLLPLLPFLCLLAADLCVHLARLRPFLGLGLTALLVLSTGAYGLAFATVYAREDSRLQAARWIAAHLPVGSVLGVERGGFSMESLVRGPRYAVRQLNAVLLFEARGLLTCRAGLAYLQDRVQELEYLALTDVNRYRQFTAAPDLVPAASAFYQKLIAGELGFELVARFKHYPSLLGIEFADDLAEPSFAGYDHPAVYVLRRQSPQAVQEAFARLAQALATDPHCPDSVLGQVAAAFRADDLQKAENLLGQAAEKHPGLALSHLLTAELHRRAGRSQQEQEFRLYYKETTRHHPGHMLPWACGLALADLGLDELADQVLVEGALKSEQFPSWAVRDMALAYVLLANYAYGLGKEQLAWNAYHLSTQIHPSTPACNRLAYLAYRRQDYRLAVHFWSRSLGLDEHQAGIQANLGQVYARHLRQWDRALYHLRRAVELKPALGPELSGWIAQASQAATAGR
jgi:tetratricopeptide (TPR) repeat protein